MSRVVRGSFVPGQNSTVTAIPSPPITVGTLAPHEGRSLPGVWFQPILRDDGTAYYQMFINAQNPGISEDLNFRRSKDGVSLAYQLSVRRIVKDKRRTTDVFNGKSWVRYLKKTDWIEPIKLH